MSPEARREIEAFVKSIERSWTHICCCGYCGIDLDWKDPDDEWPDHCGRDHARLDQLRDEAELMDG